MGLSLILSSVFIGLLLNYLVEKISSKYFKYNKTITKKLLITITTTIVFISIYYRYSFSIKTFYFLLLTSILIIITFIDIDNFIIPDELIIFGSVVSILVNIFYKNGNILSGVSCFLIPYLVAYIFSNITKKEVIGGGDLKLFFMIGLFLGTEGGILTIIMSIHIGAIFGIILFIYCKIKKLDFNSVIPFGPFISVACFLVMFLGSDTIKSILFI